MKANNLIIGQKYIWERNSSVSHEVIYLGCDDSGKYPMYEFEYLKECGKMQTSLSVHHVDSDIEEAHKTNIKRTINFNIFSSALVKVNKKNENMRGIDLLPIADENKARLKEFALQYKKFARIIVEVISVTNSRIIVRVEQKEAVNDNFLSKKELEERVRDMFNGEIPEKYKLTISAVDFDRRDIEAINIESILKKMEKLNLKQKDLCAHLGIDKSSLSLTIGEQRELTKWQKACFYYFFKYYEQSNFK